MRTVCNNYETYYNFQDCSLISLRNSFIIYEKMYHLPSIVALISSSLHVKNTPTLCYNIDTEYMGRYCMLQPQNCVVNITTYKNK